MLITILEKTELGLRVCGEGKEWIVLPTNPHYNDLHSLWNLQRENPDELYVYEWKE